MVNLDCQLDKIQNHLGDMQGMPLREFQDRLNLSRKTCLECGQHHCIGWGPELVPQWTEKTSGIAAFLSLSFLTVDPR